MSKIRAFDPDGLKPRAIEDDVEGHSAGLKPRALEPEGLKPRATEDDVEGHSKGRSHPR